MALYQTSNKMKNALFLILLLALHWMFYVVYWKSFLGFLLFSVPTAAKSTLVMTLHWWWWRQWWQWQRRWWQWKRQWWHRQKQWWQRRWCYWQRRWWQWQRKIMTMTKAMMTMTETMMTIPAMLECETIPTCLTAHCFTSRHMLKAATLAKMRMWGWVSAFTCRNPEDLKSWGFWILRIYECWRLLLLPRWVRE